MKPCLKRISRLAAVFLGILWASLSPAYAQPAVHDSLRHLLLYFQEHTADERIKQAVREAYRLYRTDALDDSLAKKLLVADEVLVQLGTLQDHQKILSYAQNLVRALQNQPPAHQHPDFAAGLQHLAAYYRVLARFQEALPLCAQALSLYRISRGEDHPDYAACLHDMALVYKDLGKYDKAISLCLQAVQVRKKVLTENHPDYAQSVNFLGSLYHNTGRFQEALPLLEQALSLYKKSRGEHHTDYAGVLYNLANLYKSAGQYEKALPLYQQALEIRKKDLGEEHPDYVAVLHNLGNLYKSTGQYERALALYNKVLDIRKKILPEDHPDYANTLNNLGNLYKNTRQYDKALPLYQQAATIRQRKLTQDHRAYASSLNNLAYVYAALNQYEKALPLYQQALSIYKNSMGEAHHDYASILDHLGDLYKNTGKYEKALPLYLQAREIRKKALGVEHRDYAASLNDLGLLYSALGKDAAATSLLTQAAHIMLKHLQQTYTTLSEQEKMAFLDREMRTFSSLPSLLYTRHTTGPLAAQQLYENELALKGMVLEDQRQVFQLIRNSGDSTAVHLFEQWRLNKGAIGEQLLLPKAKRTPALDSLQEVTNRLEQRLSRRAAAFRSLQQRQGITPADIARKLMKGEAAVEFLRFTLYNQKWTDSILYAALVLLPGDSTARFVPLFEERQLLRLLKPFLSARRYSSQYEALARLYHPAAEGAGAPPSLYGLVWKPLEKHLAGVQTVYYAPAGLLHRIAFCALRPDATHTLLDKLQLKQVLSTRTVALPAALSQKPLSVGLWGNIDYNNAGPTAPVARLPLPATGAVGDPPLSPATTYTAGDRDAAPGAWRTLPGTRMEMDSLGKLFRRAGIPIALDSGALATETSFKALSGKSPQVVHLATHGFFLPANRQKAPPAAGEEENSFEMQQDPMLRSGLVLAGANRGPVKGPGAKGQEDGILTAYDITQMDLRQTDLVVLSACETALGEVQGNEGVIGLQRAFKLAGTKQMLMSLWRARDHQTTELMTLFYRNWISGQPARAALRNAQLTLKEKYPLYLWAAFVLVE